MQKIKEARELVKNISHLQHELYLENRIVGLLKSYQIAVEVAEKAAQKKFDIKDYERLSNKVFGIN